MQQKQVHYHYNFYTVSDPHAKILSNLRIEIYFHLYTEVRLIYIIVTLLKYSYFFMYVRWCTRVFE